MSPSFLHINRTDTSDGRQGYADHVAFPELFEAYRATSSLPNEEVHLLLFGHTIGRPRRHRQLLNTMVWIIVGGGLLLAWLFDRRNLVEGLAATLFIVGSAASLLSMRRSTQRSPDASLGLMITTARTVFASRDGSGHDSMSVAPPGTITSADLELVDGFWRPDGVVRVGLSGPAGRQLTMDLARAKPDDVRPVLEAGGLGVAIAGAGAQPRSRVRPFVLGLALAGAVLAALVFTGPAHASDVASGTTLPFKDQTPADFMTPLPGWSRITTQSGAKVNLPNGMQPVPYPPGIPGEPPVTALRGHDGSVEIELVEAPIAPGSTVDWSAATTAFASISGLAPDEVPAGTLSPNGCLPIAHREGPTIASAAVAAYHDHFVLLIARGPSDLLMLIQGDSWDACLSFRAN